LAAPSGKVPVRYDALLGVAPAIWDIELGAPCA